MDAARSRSDVGVVVIGRDEGERLVRCLRSVLGQSGPVVYVDSGSSDGSVERARALGVDVVVETTQPFSAARARNSGFDHLVGRKESALMAVQFVDGDCEMDDRWIGRGAAYLDEHGDVGVVCGRVRERHPDASVYNRLGDLEWDGPVGDVKACGGNAMIRVNAFVDAGAFDPSLIAGEEPELHLRVRREGYRVVRLEQEMVLHDLAMSSFRQWWRRSVRAGHAYAEGAHLHGREPERFCVRELVSIVAWGGALPTVTALLAPPTLGLSISVLAALYGRLWWRIYRDQRSSRGRSTSDATLYATSCVVGKLAQMQGAATFAWTRLVRRQESQLIEHKRG